MRPPKNQRYIHGSRPREQRRLSGLNELLNQACLRELALTGGDSVLDVGSGLGQFTRDMARAVAPGGRVIGVERDKSQFAEASGRAKKAGEMNLVEWRRGDALELPLETARDVITGPLGFSKKQFERTLRGLRRWGRRPDAALWYGLCWAEGVRG